MVGAMLSPVADMFYVNSNALINIILMIVVAQLAHFLNLLFLSIRPSIHSINQYLSKVYITFATSSGFHAIEVTISCMSHGMHPRSNGLKMAITLITSQCCPYHINRHFFVLFLLLPNCVQYLFGILRQCQDTSYQLI